MRFAVSGELHLDTSIPVGSNVTIDGRGANVVITDAGLTMDGVTNVIVTNLTFAGSAANDMDAISIRAATRHVWIDHCDFSGYSDGLIDITRGATDVTVSWNRFHDHGKVMLINLAEDSSLPEPSRVTVHHNVFAHTARRDPYVRFALVHAYNNHLVDWYGSGMSADTGAQLASEANVFESTGSVDAVKLFADGRARSVADHLLGGAVAATRDPDLVFDPAAYYQATIDVAGDWLVGRLAVGVGPQLVPTTGPWELVTG